MNPPIASNPVPHIRTKLVSWPLYLGIPLGVALAIVLRNPALGLGVVGFSAVVFLPLNVRIEGRRAKITSMVAPLLMLLAIALAATGNTTPVWAFFGFVVLYYIFVTRR